MRKPHLATDIDLSKFKGPAWVFPKIDGVRALHLNGAFTGRSLKPHANRNLTAFYDRDIFANLDGELTIGDICDGSTCRRTTSGVTTVNGPNGQDFGWHIFDDLEMLLPYHKRYDNASKRVHNLNIAGLTNITLVPFVEVRDADHLIEVHLATVAQGYEGTITRSPMGKHKDGRATVNEGAFLRLKDFTEAEAIVLSIEEGFENTNKAVVNPLGYTERSSHKENKIANGMVGALICKDLESGKEIKVAAGCMTHSERVHYFNNQHELIGKLITYKTMLYGRMDKPRFPTFQRIRPLSDMP